MSPTHQHNIEKLRGSENFEDWKFAVEAYFKMQKLWAAVEGTEVLVDKLVQAKSELVFLIEKNNYTHIRTCESAKDIWKKLSDLFENSGLVRKVRNFAIQNLTISTALRTIKTKFLAVHIS